MAATRRARGMSLVLACLCAIAASFNCVNGRTLLKTAVMKGKAPAGPAKMMETGLTVVRNPDGTLGLAEVADDFKRPFKLVFYEEFNDSQSPEIKKFIMQTVMPAAQSLLARYVRHPSGNLQFSGRLDADDKPIPPGPEKNGEYDADLVVKIVARGGESVCSGPIAFARPVLFETLTRRPTFGQITFCLIDPAVDFANNMQVVLHEFIHVLGFAGQLYGTFFGYQGGIEEVVDITPISVYNTNYDYYAYAPFDYTLPGPSTAPSPAGAAPPTPAGTAPPPSQDYADAEDPRGRDVVSEYFDYYFSGAFDYYDDGTPVSGPDAAAPYAYGPYSSDYGNFDDAYLPYAFGPYAYAPYAYSPYAYGPYDYVPFDSYGSGSFLDVNAAVERLTPEAAIVTPNALREARAHFGCEALEDVELQAGFLTSPGSHWSQRLYNGDIMRPAASTTTSHYNREAITDLTLGFLQDTGWYDVKYGSGGFNTYGYQAGCAFVNGTLQEILEDPVARRFVCPAEDFGYAECLHDFSGEGACIGGFLTQYDDFYAVEPFRKLTNDCQLTPGSRCVNDPDEEGVLPCLSGFECSEGGEVLINGTKCTDVTEGCPPDEFMCRDPGLLTCATPELNDCNGQGDCRQGRCFCHVGWGGDDCSVQGSPCPASGFCGVPECGEWSFGDEGKGTPCTSN